MALGSCQPRAPPLLLLLLLTPASAACCAQATHKRLVIWLEELRHRLFYPYLWEQFWSLVKLVKAVMAG